MFRSTNLKPWVFDSHLRHLLVWFLALFLVFLSLTLLVLFAWFLPQDREWSRWTAVQRCKVLQIYESSRVCASSHCQYECSDECVKHCITENFACSSIEARIEFSLQGVNRTAFLKGPQEKKSYQPIAHFRDQYPAGKVFQCYYLSSSPNEVFSKRTGKNPYSTMIVVGVFSVVSAILLLTIIVLFLRERTLKEQARMFQRLDDEDI